MPKIILMSGWAGSGKDTAGLHLIENHDYRRFSFADALKSRLIDSGGLDRDDLYFSAKKDAPLYNMPVLTEDSSDLARVLYSSLTPLLENHWSQDATGNIYWTPRAFAVLIGCAARSVDPLYWVKRTINEIEASDACKIVITDVRFRNEIEHIKSHFGEHSVTVARVNRFEECKHTDPSERELDNYPDFDFVIQNKGTIEDLKRQIEIVEGLQKSAQVSERGRLCA